MHNTRGVTLAETTDQPGGGGMVRMIPTRGCLLWAHAVGVCGGDLRQCKSTALRAARASASGSDIGTGGTTHVDGTSARLSTTGPGQQRG